MRSTPKLNNILKSLFHSYQSIILLEDFLIFIFRKYVYFYSFFLG